jgi:hypothetical protein
MLWASRVEVHSLLGFGMRASCIPQKTTVGFGFQGTTVKNTMDRVVLSDVKKAKQGT